jgi:putative N6-adenine-specific DNA methylase
MRANLWLRTASRVLVRLASFRATAFYELEKSAKRIPWQDFAGEGSAPEFRVTTRKSKLYHSDAIAQRLAESASRAGTQTTRAAPRGGARSASVPASAQLFVVRVVHDEFTISADSSGELLHLRGYRLATGKAPLRENLAAALLMAAGWNGDSALLDPFCGSGTIPIEGALIARRIAPGLRRDFAFTHWAGFDTPLWRAVKRDAEASALAGSPITIHGSDRDAGAIQNACANAERAGVAKDIEFSRLPVSSARPGSASGLVATNPPYGKRVGGAQDLRNLYAQLGKTVRERFDGWSVALYSPEPRLSAQVGLPFEEVLQTVNGGIRVSALVSGARS